MPNPEDTDERAPAPEPIVTDDTCHTHEDDTEDETPLYAEFLNETTEVHAFGHGIYAGLTTATLTPPKIPDNDDVEREIHYFKGGYLVGTLIQVALLVVAATYGLPLLA